MNVLPRLRPSLCLLWGILGVSAWGESPVAKQQPGELLAGESWAICYSGYRSGQHPDRGHGAKNPSREQILEDLRILSKQAGFRLIRLYDSRENSQTVLSLIREHQLELKVLLGAWLSAEVNNPGCPWQKEPYPQELLGRNRAENDKEVSAMIRLANAYPETVVAVAVGNEALVEWNDHMVPADRVIKLVRRVKKEVEQPVTVADNYDWWAKHGAKLADVVDFVSIHIYPVWEGKDIGEALPYSEANVQAVQRALPDHPIVITEAGWATTASEFGERASEAKQQRHYHELKRWARDMNITTFFFEAFDEDWKGDPNNPAGAEKHWGIFTIDRQPKAVLRETPSPTPSP